MKNLETILDKYFEYNTWILVMTLIFMLLLITISVAEIITSKIKFKVYPLLEKIYLSFFIITISVALPLINVKLQIEYVYFNILCFATFILFIAVYIISNIIKHKECLSILRHCMSYISIAIWFQFFLLGVSENLQVLEIANGLATICLIETFGIIIKQEIKKREMAKCTIIGSGYSNRDLYGTRKRQFDRFLEILEQQKDQPYAIMISGKWGCGKTSFIDALVEKLSNHSFIRINAGGEKNVSEIMKDISSEIIQILKDNNIYLERSGLIEDYFLSFTQMLDEVGLGFFHKLLETLGLHAKEAGSQKYVNSKLEKLKKTIFLIIDDLDRCDNEYRMKMFKVIRESTDLKNCKTIFLADDTMFMTSDCDINYIEKYISYNLRLCKVEYEEIAEYYLVRVLDDNFLSGIKPDILRNNESETIRQIVIEYPINTLNKLNALKKETPKDSVLIEEINKTISDIEKNTTNSRKVLNFFNEIKFDLSHLNTIWGDRPNEYKTGDWFDLILKTQFVKHFLQDDYMQMMEYSNIQQYISNCKISIKTIFQYKRNFSLNSNKEIEMLDYAIYKLDTVDFSINKTKQETYLEQLDNNTANIIYFKQYIKYIPFEKIVQYFTNLIELYNSNDTLSSTQKVEFFTELLEKLSKRPIPVSEEYYDLSQQIINSLKCTEWNSDDIKTWNDYAKIIINNCITGNHTIIKRPLYIIYGLHNVEEEWRRKQVDNLEDFLQLLAILTMKVKYKQTTNNTRNFYLIESFYKQLENQFTNNNTCDPNIDYNYLFKQCYLLFNICKLWAKPFSSCTTDENKLKFETYFNIKSLDYTANTFTDFNTLNEALGFLQEFYLSSKENYQADYTLLIYRTVYNMLNIINNNPYWFNNQHDIIYSKIFKILKYIDQLYTPKDEEEKHILEMLKIFIFDFKQHCAQLEQTCGQQNKLELLTKNKDLAE